MFCRGLICFHVYWRELILKWFWFSYQRSCQSWVVWVFLGCFFFCVLSTNRLHHWSLYFTLFYVILSCNNCCCKSNYHTLSLMLGTHVHNFSVSWLCPLPRCATSHNGGSLLLQGHLLIKASGIIHNKILCNETDLLFFLNSSCSFLR